ncbi:MAG: hypothetical protein A3F68_11245 [Acidobacteria bacterium RIFCSPLOWO2_12_FULL_54_10]|nr:MAG: hypothetical protein A3F68_11245 [Acidobacteria bacterium RIFCSPLOWO2_12_FULL_54_10]
MNHTASGALAGPRPISGSQNHLLRAALLLICVPLIGAALLLGVLPQMTLLSFALAATAAGFVLWTGRDFDILHPVRILGCLWFFCLALASLQLDTGISEWGVAMWGYVCLGFLAFAAGFRLISTFLAGNRSLHAKYKNRALPYTELLLPRRTLVIATACLAVGAAAFTYEFIQLGEIPIFAENPNASRARLFGIAGMLKDPALDTIIIKVVHVFTAFCKYGLYLACIMLFQKTKNTKAQIFCAAVLIAVGFVFHVSQGGRQFVYEPAAVALVLFHYLRRPLRSKELAAFAVFTLLVISVMGYQRAMASADIARSRQADRWSKLPSGATWDVIAQGYHTTTTSFEVFYRLTQDLPALRPPSGFLFYSLHRFLPRESIQELALRLYTGEMITPTVLGEFYGDFGIVGILVGPLILGVMYGYIYFQAMSYNSLTRLFNQALFLEILTYFPYVNLLSHYATWTFDVLFMACLIAIAKGGSKRKPH